MKLGLRLLVVIVVVVLAIQFIRPNIPASPATVEIQAPPKVTNILNQKCYSCHSNERRLAWFDEIQPGYWLVRKDVLAARDRLNFSTLGSQAAAVQKSTLYEAVNMIQLGSMPLPRFLLFHSDARVTPQELAVLKAYLAPWSSSVQLAGKAGKRVDQEGDSSSSFVSLAEARPEYNGLPLDPSMRAWKIISVTDRGDNNTFRLILGNEIAIRAIRAGRIQPWPDGAKIAKVAFERARGDDGLIRPKNFVQIELMAKDAQLYHSTEGWGWGRWRGPTLVPYGTSIEYLKECTGCHLPMKGNDNVYTLPIGAAHIEKDETINNAAVLPQRLPYQPLDWIPITMFVDPASETVSVLFANDLAAEQEQSAENRISGLHASLAHGGKLALITWQQREDPHWFGARIPSDPKSVEFLTGDALHEIRYQCFEGRDLRENQKNAAFSEQRTKLILDLAPAEYPE
jgi:hypothetical protein